MQIGVVFDLDGVLIDSEGLQHRAYGAILERYGVRVDKAEYADRWIRTGTGPEYAVARYGLPISAEELRAMKAPIYHEILRAEARLMPGVEAALDRLRVRFPLAVATNSGAPDTDYVLDRFGLRGAFAAVITRERYVHPKPAPDCIVAAAEALGVAPAACAVIEDSQRGVGAAHRAGATAIAVPNEYTDKSDFSFAAAILGSLDELTVPLVEALVPRRGGRPPR